MKQRTTLFADDNLRDELLTLRALKQVHVLNAIDVVRDEAEALDYRFCRREYAERDPTELPALVLLDIKPPKLSGFEVLKQLHAERKTQLLPVVILTASDEEADLIASYQLGVNSFLRKPLDFVEFSQAIAKLVFYWLVINKNPYDKNLHD